MIHCGKCGSWKKKEIQGKKKQVQEFTTRIVLTKDLQSNFPLALILCGDCDAVISGQIVETDQAKTPGGLVIP